MVTGTMAGLLLNWTAPLCVLAAAAWINTAFHPSAQTWLVVAGGFCGVTAFLMILYGVALRFGAGARVGAVLLAWGAGITILSLVVFFVERGYSLFSDALTLHWSVSGVTAAAVVAGPAIVRYLPIFQTFATTCIRRRRQRC